MPLLTQSSSVRSNQEWPSRTASLKDFPAEKAGTCSAGGGNTASVEDVSLSTATIHTAGAPPPHG